MRRLLLAFASLMALATAPVGAQPAGDAAQTPPPPPRAPLVRPAPSPSPTLVRRPTLIVAISVDQFSADLFAQYRRFYRAGLARLQDGAVFPQGFQSHAATETCPGHSTLMTGDHPARTGIIANTWFDSTLPRAEKNIYCVEDETDPASSPANPVVSAGHLMVPTLGERIKAAYPGSRNVAVSGKDRAAIMMGGHAIDAVYWYRNDPIAGEPGKDRPAKSASFVTLRGRTASSAAQAENAALAKLLHTGAPAFAVPAFCAARAMPIGIRDQTVGTGRFALGPDQPDALRVSPRLDQATVDLALRLVDEMKLGGRRTPDVLSVSLSANAYVGPAYGTGGLEMCIEQAEVDRLVGVLLAGLDARGIDYLVVLTADHGGFDAPERLDEQALPSATRASPALSAASLSQTVGAATGITSAAGPLILADGAGGDYYVAKDLAPAARSRVIAALRQTLAADPQVALAMTADELAQVPAPTGSPQDFTLAQRARASFYPGRSGDVVALLKRGVVGVIKPAKGYVATHGSPWDYDRRVPMLFWRRGMTGFEQPAPVETIDIAPTLAAVAGLRVQPGEMDGRCLDLDAGAGDTCAVR
jgi:predicted AlkP superfamily pyrophosphatase or phosphodiesterase